MDLLTPGFGLFFWSFIIFSLIVFILGKFAFKPIGKAIKQREESIENALKAAEKAKEEMANLQADNEKFLAEAKEERAIILKEANALKDTIVSDAKTKAKIEADKIIANAKQEIENQKNAVLSEIKENVGGLAIEVAEKILRRELSTDKMQNELTADLVGDIKLN